MSENQPKQLTRHDMREIALRCVYQHLLLGTDIRKCVFDAMRGNNNIDGYLYALTIGTIEHEQEYIDIISKYLRKDWSFDRLSVLEQAILLVSLQEILQNDIPKPVVINEAIKLAKNIATMIPTN